MWNKEMKSLSSSPLHSSLSSSIKPPENPIHNSNYNNNNNNNDLIPKRKYKKVKNILNTLDKSKNKPNSSPSKKKQKRDVYIHEETSLINNNNYKSSSIFNLNDNSDNNDDNDGIMKEFNVDDIIDQSAKIKKEIDLLKKRKDRDISEIPNTSSNNNNNNIIELSTDDNESNNEIELFHKKKNKEIKSLDGLINNEEKIKEITDKFHKSKPYIEKNIKLIKSMKDLEKFVKKYEDNIIDILNGKRGSYFYMEAKKIAKNSPLLTIRDNELNNLPKNKYYGFIGAIRGFQIGKIIENNKKVGGIINKLSKSSEIIKFWTINKFIQFIIVPEVIAMIIKDICKLKDMDDIYDEMEDTNEYGVYITNRIPIEESIIPINTDFSSDLSSELSSESDNEGVLSFLN